MRRFSAIILSFLVLLVGDSSAGESQTTINCSSVSSLGAFAHGYLKEALIAHLMASGEWSVRDAQRTIEATYERRDGVETFIQENTTDKQLHMSIYWGTSPLEALNVVTAGTAIVELNLERSRDASETLGSRLCVQAPGIELRIGEWNAGAERKFTEQALKYISEILSSVPSNAASIAEGEYGNLPRGSVLIQDKDTMQVRDGPQDGIYIVAGYVNAGEPGYVVIRAYRISDDLRLTEKEINRNTKEYVAFSPDKNKRYRYESRILLSEGGWRTKYQARFELWFCSAKGNERMLASCVRDVYGWQK